LFVYAWIVTYGRFHATVELYMTFIKSCVVLNIAIKIKILDYRIESK